MATIRLLAEIDAKRAEAQAAVEALPPTKELIRQRALSRVWSFRRMLDGVADFVATQSLQIATEFANLDGLLAETPDALTREEVADLPAIKASASRVRAILDRAAADIRVVTDAEKELATAVVVEGVEL